MSRKYEPLIYNAEGGQAKDAFIELLEAIVTTIKKDNSEFFTFTIKIKAEGHSP